MNNSDKFYIIGGIREGAASVSAEVIDPSGAVKKLRMTKKLWERYAYSSGDTVTPEVFGMMLSDSERCEAVTRALGYLKAAPLSYRALHMKLKSAGCTDEAADAALALVRKKRLIDEETQAADIAESQVRRNKRGRERVVAYLQSKGYSTEISRRGADSVDDELYRDALRDAIAKKCRDGVPRDKAQRDKFIASLVRQGFSVAEIIKEMNTPEDE